MWRCDSAWKLDLQPDAGMNPRKSGELSEHLRDLRMPDDVAAIRRRLKRQRQRLRETEFHFIRSEHPRLMTAPGVREETMELLRCKVNGSAVMPDTSLVRARGVRSATVASPLLSMVRIVVNGEAVDPLLDQPDPDCDPHTFVCGNTLRKIGRAAADHRGRRSVTSPPTSRRPMQR